MSTASLEETPPGEGQPQERLLLLAVGGRWFGMALAPVREVITARPFTRLPGAPAPVRGLINLRGRVVTVADLGSLLQLPPASAAPGHRVVLVEHRGKQVGLAVDDVARIVRVDAMSLLPAGAHAGAARATTGEVDGRAFTVLDTDALLHSLFA